MWCTIFLWAPLQRLFIHLSPLLPVYHMQTETPSRTHTITVTSSSSSQEGLWLPLLRWRRLPRLGGDGVGDAEAEEVELDLLLG